MLYIGNDVQDRMNMLGLSVEELADKTFLEVEIIQGIADNEIALADIDEFDLSLICSVLHCKKEFFTDPDIKEKDLLISSMNRGFDNEKSVNVKAKIQDFMDDYIFVTDILKEER